MPQDFLSHLPLEILHDILGCLDPFDLLLCRVVCFGLKRGVESLPEYVAYITTQCRLLKLYDERMGKGGVWRAVAIRRFVDLTRLENPPSDLCMLMILHIFNENHGN